MNLSYLITLLLLILATYRLARLFTIDVIFEGFRLALGRQASSDIWVWKFLAELFSCPFCLGIWVSGILCVFFTHSIQEWFLVSLAVAGGQTFLQACEGVDE